MWQETTDIKDLGKLKYFHGIELAHPKKGAFLSQQKYTLQLIGEKVMQGATP